MNLKKRADLISDIKKLKAELSKHEEVVMCLRGAIGCAQKTLDENEEQAIKQQSAIINSLAESTRAMHGTPGTGIAQTIFHAIMRGDIPGVGFVDFNEDK